MCRSPSQGVRSGPPGSWPVAVPSCCTVSAPGQHARLAGAWLVKASTTIRRDLPRKPGRRERQTTPIPTAVTACGIRSPGAARIMAGHSPAIQVWAGPSWNGPGRARGQAAARPGRLVVCQSGPELVRMCVLIVPWGCGVRTGGVYPERCANGHERGPGLITVSWMPCACPPGLPRSGAVARQGSWRCSATRHRGCRSVWYRPRHEPGLDRTGDRSWRQAACQRHQSTGAPRRPAGSAADACPSPAVTL